MNLRDYKGMLDEGLISQEEYEEVKKQILSAPVNKNEEPKEATKEEKKPNKKASKAIIIIIAVILIGVVGTIVGFGLLKNKNKDNNKDNNKGIKLTMDNYQQYLDVSSSWDLTGDEYGIFQGVCPEQTKGGQTIWSWYKKIGYHAIVNGVSTNYNYNDVVVVFKVSGTYDTFALENGEWVREEDNPIDLTIEITTDIAGNGDDWKTVSSGRWIHENLVNSTIEVVSVSGTVTPVK